MMYHVYHAGNTVRGGGGGGGGGTLFPMTLALQLHCHAKILPGENFSLPGARPVHFSQPKLYRPVQFWLRKMYRAIQFSPGTILA